jgi:hypothetical protein
MNQSHSPQAPLASLNPGNATEANAIAQRAHAEVSNMAQKLKDAGGHVALESFCTHFNFEPMACLDMIGDARRRAEVREPLTQGGRTLVSLSAAQIANFVGNAMELQGRDGRVLALSRRALLVLTPHTPAYS